MDPVGVITAPVRIGVRLGREAITMARHGVGAAGALFRGEPEQAQREPEQAERKPRPAQRKPRRPEPKPGRAERKREPAEAARAETETEREAEPERAEERLRAEEPEATPSTSTVESPPPPSAPPATPTEPAADSEAPPAPAHVDEQATVVAEFAEPGAEDGAGAELELSEPWEGYDGMKVEELIPRLAEASTETLAAVMLYERATRQRGAVVEEAERQLRRRNPPGGS